MEKGWKHKKTVSGNVILKDKQEDLKKSLQNSGLNIDFGGYEEFDGENLIYVHYPKKDEDKVANFLNNWLSKHSWKNSTTAYESVDDFSGKKGYWTYVIEEANHSMAKGGEVGKKVYNTMFGVGSSKYVVNYHDGVKTHKDGSEFFDIATFKNKVDFNKFVNKLKKDGYVQGHEHGGKMAKGGGVGTSSKLKYSLYLDRTVGDNVTTYHIADFAAKGDLSIALESLKAAAPKNYMYYTK